MAVNIVRKPSHLQRSNKYTQLELKELSEDKVTRQFQFLVTYNFTLLACFWKDKIETTCSYRSEWELGIVYKNTFIKNKILKYLKKFW